MTYFDSETQSNITYAHDQFHLAMLLSRERYNYERRAYTFVQVLSDFGGFNDGILLVFQAVVAVYANAKYK